MLITFECLFLVRFKLEGHFILTYKQVPAKTSSSTTTTTTCVMSMTFHLMISEAECWEDVNIVNINVECLLSKIRC
ncbi:hypothetical protein ACF0H5_013935 [Mactra antiquata]